jgi:hypothetical protein
MTDLTIEDKASILFKHGFLRRADMSDTKRIEARWLIYIKIPQKENLLSCWRKR